MPEIILPDPKVLDPKKEDPKLTALKHAADQLTAEVGYHKASVNRIDEIRGYLHKGTYQGEEAIRLSGCLQWLKSVKQNVKFMAEQTENKLKTAVDAIKEFQREAKNGDENKK